MTGHIGVVTVTTPIPIGGSIMASLRGADHPYYATHGNYYSNECYAEYEGWDDFLESEGDSDPDLNLVYRWDWHGNQLSIFYVGQRKALHRSALVSVDSTDEPRIREWLELRWETIVRNWWPISKDDTT